VTETVPERKPYPITPAVREQRRLARTTHGAQSGAHLAPLIVSMKKSLLARMGLRLRDLDWHGRELVHVYCACQAKITCVDQWLAENPMIDAAGNPAPVLKFYIAALNTSVRTLEALRGVLAQMAKEDARFDKALSSLAAEGARIREARES
jgi:hypothetical protein